MNFFKKLIDKLKRNKKRETEKKAEPWYNDKMNTYDPKSGTLNGEAYISPDSVSIGITNRD